MLSATFLRPFARRHQYGSVFVDAACGLGDAVAAALEAGFEQVYGLDIGYKQQSYCATRFGKMPSVCFLTPNPTTPLNRIATLLQELLCKHLSKEQRVTLWLPNASTTTEMLQVQWLRDRTFMPAHTSFALYVDVDVMPRPNAAHSGHHHANASRGRGGMGKACPELYSKRMDGGRSALSSEETHGRPALPSVCIGCSLGAISTQLECR